MSLNILAPIITQEGDPYSHLSALRSLITRPSWTTIEQDNFKILPMLHMARFQIIQHLTPAMGDVNNTRKLRFDYLLFIAEIDGTAEDFYDYLYRQELQPQIGSPEPEDAGKFVRRIWSHCAGYPAVNHDQIYLFRQFMKRYEFKSMIDYRAVKDSRDKILRALCIKEFSAAWMQTQQSLVSDNASATQIQAHIQNYLLDIDKMKRLTMSKLTRLYEFIFRDSLPDEEGQITRDFGAIHLELEEITS